MDYNTYYLNQAGGGYDDYYMGVPVQRGSGIGAVFKRFFKWITPIVKNNVGPVAKNIGHQVVGSLGSLAKDVVNKGVC